MSIHEASVAFRCPPLRLCVMAVVVSVVALSSCSSGGSEALALLNKDPVFGLVPPGGKIEWSAFPPGCGGGSDSSEGGNEVFFTFEGEQAAVVAFYLSGLPDQGWAISRQLPDLTAVAINARKEIEDETYLLTVSIGRGSGRLVGTTPPGKC